MKVTSVEGDDWHGLYIDGKLVTQNECIDGRFILHILSQRGLIDFEDVFPDQDWLEGTDFNYPPNLADVVLED